MFEDINTSLILKGVFSSPKKDSIYKKVNIKKIMIKDKEVLQFEAFTNTQAFHKNVEPSESISLLNEYMDMFNQLSLYTNDYIYGYRVTSKGKLLSNKHKNMDNIVVSNHNKDKKYLINEGMIVPPLIDLGVMTPDGKIVKAQYDKFKQINKFLEIIDSTIGYDDNLNIIDFGCGKSYLTFVVYYYLAYVKNIKVKIIGLDLKAEVIKNCNQIRDKYNYENLNFLIGDISLYKPSENVDMIITLHACDKATDYALYHAIMLNCKYILSVPCCQHEINSKLDSLNLHIMNKYGLFKDRFSSLLTDSIRANILEYFGYRVNILEFVDFNHSPKNVLIKGIKTSEEKNEKIKEEIDNILKEYNITQELYKLVFKNGN